MNDTPFINPPASKRGSNSAIALPIPPSRKHNMPSQFEFVHTDPTVKLKPGKSLLVRSRCMQGKNKRAGSRRSQQEQKRNAKKKAAATVTHNTSLTGVPPSIDQFSLVRFASDKIEPEGRDLIFQAFRSNVVNQALSPLEACVDFDSIETVSLHWVFIDATFTHLILSATYCINDIQSTAWNGQPGKKFVFHLNETLSLLSKRLVDTDVHNDEAILYIIIQLALLAAVAGDWDAIAAHLAGLRRIVQLRGGWAFLRTRPKLHFKLDRLDLAWSLSSGNEPFFLHPTVSWEPITNTSLSTSDSYHPDPTWHYSLRSVFQDFQRLAHNINRYTQKRSRLEASCFQNSLSILQSRLMHLEAHVDTPVERLVRLSLLAFLATTFKVPGRKIPYTWIASMIENEYIYIVMNDIHLDRPLRLWILFISAILVTTPPRQRLQGWAVHQQKQKEARDTSATLQQNPWIQEAWIANNPFIYWDDIKAELMHVMWIEDIHDWPGKIIWKQLNAPSISM